MYKGKQHFPKTQHRNPFIGVEVDFIIILARVRKTNQQFITLFAQKKSCIFAALIINK